MHRKKTGAHKNNQSTIKDGRTLCDPAQTHKHARMAGTTAKITSVFISHCLLQLYPSRRKTVDA